MKKMTKTIVIAIVTAIALGIAEHGKFNDRYMASRYYDGYEEEDVEYMLLFAPKYIREIAKDANHELKGSAKYTVFDTVRVSEYAFSACDAEHVLVRTWCDRTDDARACWYRIDLDSHELYYDSEYNQ